MAVAAERRRPKCGRPDSPLIPQRQRFRQMITPDRLLAEGDVPHQFPAIFRASQEAVFVRWRWPRPWSRARQLFRGTRRAVAGRSRHLHRGVLPIYNHGAVRSPRCCACALCRWLLRLRRRPPRSMWHGHGFYRLFLAYCRVVLLMVAAMAGRVGREGRDLSCVVLHSKLLRI
jgi:hypothetical protein